MSSYERFRQAGLDWIGHLWITEALVQLAAADNFGVVLDSTKPKTLTLPLRDPKRGAEY